MGTLWNLTRIKRRVLISNTWYKVSFAFGEQYECTVFRFILALMQWCLFIKKKPWQPSGWVTDIFCIESEKGKLVRRKQNGTKSSKRTLDISTKVVETFYKLMWFENSALKSQNNEIRIHGVWCWITPKWKGKILKGSIANKEDCNT